MISLGEIQKKYLGKIEPLELEVLISFIIKKSREFILAHPEYIINKKQTVLIDKLIKRRIAHEPVAYIIGRKEFFGLDFRLTRDTLIPRPETELLVEEALKHMHGATPEKENGLIVDVGTGSGNIIISFAKNIKNKRSTKYFASDISNGALEVAKINAKLHGVNKQISFLQGSLLSPLIKALSPLEFPSFLLIIANLPYLSDKIYDKSPANVRKYEPKNALYSPRQGLLHYEKLLKQARLLNAKHEFPITIFLEISPEQKTVLKNIVKKIFPRGKISFKKDLAGKWRMLKIEPH